MEIPSGRVDGEAVQGTPRARACLAWQSKVGPATWLEPSVEHMLEALAKGGVKDLVLVPTVFVSEHSETLYELDVLYGGMARELGMSVTRVPTVQTTPRFIEALASRVRLALKE
jgi:ferrochelatase